MLVVLVALIWSTVFDGQTLSLKVHTFCTSWGDINFLVALMNWILIHNLCTQSTRPLVNSCPKTWNALLDSAKSKSSFQFLPVPKFIHFIMNKLQVCTFVRWWKLSLEMLSQYADTSLRTVTFWSLGGQSESTENLCWSFTELLTQNLVL